MSITALPTPPSRLDPTNFSARADAFLGALPQFAVEANALETNIQYNSQMGNCTTTMTIASGTKTISTQTNKAWAAGQYVYLISTVDYTAWMIGQVTSYNVSSGALIVNALIVNGSGSYSSWSIVPSTPPLNAANITGGSTGQILYQTAANTTGFITPDKLVATATTVGGTANAITATFSPTITAFQNGMTVFVNSVSANTTLTPTLAVDGLAAKTIVLANGQSLGYGDIGGNGHLLELVYDSASDKWKLINPSSPILSDISKYSVGLAQAGGTLTLYLYPCHIDFPDAANSGLTRSVSINSTLNIAVPNGATLGVVSGKKYRIALLAVLPSSGGTPQLAVVNAENTLSLNEENNLNTILISTSADSSNAVYSATSSLTGATYRVIGWFEGTNTTNSVWVAPTLMSSSSKVGQTSPRSQLYSYTPTTSGTSISFPIPSWAKKITVGMNGLSTNGTAQAGFQLSSDNTVITSSYAGAMGWWNSTGNGYTNISNLLPIGGFNYNTDARHGVATFMYMGASVWTYSYAGGLSSSSTIGVSGGTCYLPAGGLLDAIKLTTTNGTDTFDGGAITVLVEGYV